MVNRRTSEISGYAAETLIGLRADRLIPAARLESAAAIPAHRTGARRVSLRNRPGASRRSVVPITFSIAPS
jgi:hypothetical protein